MKVLVTGGAGYIGSHTCLSLLKNGFDVVVMDNLSNSKKTSIKRVEKLSGKKIDFREVDLLDIEGMDKLFSESEIGAVIHFAGKKAVGESVKIPLDYYKNNFSGTVNLLEVMAKHKVKKIVFSSSCTVYGNTDKVPITEDFPVSAASPYGRTKLFIEQMLGDVYIADNDWHIIILRYFNPVGADPSGEIGEDPNGIPNNLFPYITQVAIGRLPKLSIFGGDYPTRDGTCIRDYIHVSDLAEGHVKALDKAEKDSGLFTYNLGTGRGYSVLEAVKAFQEATGKEIPYEIVERREGDVVEVYADTTKAKNELMWEAKKSLLEMCKDAWNFQSKNPQGYQ